MKKTAKLISIKPISLAAAIAAGATLSFVANALPIASSKSLSAVNGIVNEDICLGNVSTVISSATRAASTTSNQCQNRNVDPTVGIAGTSVASSNTTRNDSAAMIKHGAAGDTGQELYVAEVGGKREAAVTMTPNRALSITRYTTGNRQSGLSSELSASVQNASGGNAGWLSGSYTFVQNRHEFRDMTNGIQEGGVNYLGSLYDSEYTEPTIATATFGGNGTCTFDSYDERYASYLTKDPDNIGNQPDGGNYALRAPVDWVYINSLTGNSRTPVSCSYTWDAGDTVSVTWTINDSGLGQNQAWTTVYNISKDLRYLVGTDGRDDLSYIPTYGQYTQGIDMGIRAGAVNSTNYVGKTYLYNAPVINWALTTSNDPGFENPYLTHLMEQQVECMARGTLTLNSGGTCSANELSTCVSRGFSGHGESSVGALDGTIDDNLSVSEVPTSPTSCSYTVSGTGHLNVVLGINAPGPGPSTITLDGQMSDNGEAFALAGRWAGTPVGTNPGDLPPPDINNVPVIPESSYTFSENVYGTRYDGNLATDTDGNGYTNSREFMYARLSVNDSAVRGDIDGDRYGDVSVWNQSTGAGYGYLMNANNLRVTVPNQGTIFTGYLPSAYTKVAVADFNRDGTNDVLVRNNSTGAWTLIANGVGAPGSTPQPVAMTTDLTWNFVAALDLNGDGYKDVLMRNSSTNAWYAYILKGSVVMNSGALALSLTVTDVFAAAGDFNGDVREDIMLRKADGTWYLYDMDGLTVIRGGAPTMQALNWDLVGVGDYNNDGTKDIMLRCNASGPNPGYFLEYTFNDFSHASVSRVKSSSGMPMTQTLAWSVVDVADYDGNGTTDFLLRNTSTGAWYLYGIGGALGQTVVGQTVIPASTSLSWVYQTSGDYNGDGKTDILVRNSSTNAWYMYGFGSYVSGSVLSFQGAVPASTDVNNQIIK